MPEPIVYPLRVEFYRRCVEWDEQPMPYIVDANGQSVCDMAQRVGHPGVADPELIKLAELFVIAANATEAGGI